MKRHGEDRDVQSMKTSAEDRQRHQPREADVHKSLLLYFICLLNLWVIGLIAVQVQTRVFHRTAYPFSTLFFIQKYRFTDLTIFYPKLMAFGNPQTFFSSAGPPFTYPAPLLLIAVALWRWTSFPLAVYICSVLAFAGLAGITAFRMFPNRGRLTRIAASAALSATAFSFPLYFLVDRANLEGFVWMASAVGLYAFAKKRYYSAAAFLALAASMKIFPGLLLFLFLAKRRYRDFLISAGFTVGFTVFSLWLTGPSILEAASGLTNGIDQLRKAEVMSFVPREIGFDHSLFTFLKWIALLSTDDIPSYRHLIQTILPIYTFCAIGAFIAIYFARLRRMPVLNQVIGLTALAIVLPFSSFEYTLVHLAAPFVFLLIFLATDVASGTAAFNRNEVYKLIIPFAVLFAPLSFLIIIITGIGGQIKSAALVYLVILCARLPMRSSLFDELNVEDTKLAQPKEQDSAALSRLG